MQSKIFAFIKLYPFITLSSLFLQNKTTVFWTLSFFLENPTVAVSVRKTPDGQTLRAWADRRLASSAPLSPRPPRSNPAPGHRAPAARWWPTPLQWPSWGRRARPSVAPTTASSSRHTPLSSLPGTRSSPCLWSADYFNPHFNRSSDFCENSIDSQTGWFVSFELQRILWMVFVNFPLTLPFHHVFFLLPASATDWTQT